MLLAALTAVSGCSVGRGSLNAQLPVLEASVDQALARDELAQAEPLARDLEQRLPGTDTFALLGRVLWRTGRLLDAEAFHRRSAAGGLPEGRLGVAHARAASGELDEAADLLGPLLELPRVADRAGRLLAAVELARGDTVAAVRALSVAAETPMNPRRDLDRAEASALQQIGAPYGLWSGEASRLPVAAGGVVEATLDGRSVRARLALHAARSVVGPEAAAAGVEPVRSATVGVGRMATRAVLLVAELEPGVDLLIGFDLLSRAHWSLDGASSLFEIAARPGELTPLALPRTHWTGVRLPRNGLGVQLVALPRFAGFLRASALDLGGPTRLDRRAAEELGLQPEGGRVRVEVRVGGWRAEREVEVADLYPLGTDGSVAPRAMLGTDLLGEWRLVWEPGDTQLALQRSAPTDE